MPTECNATLFEFEAVERRAVVAGFDGGDITSNAGALLLGQVDRGLCLIRRFGECFTDRRDPRYVEHRIETLVGQRIFGLVLGYEDLNDHDELRKDTTFGVLAGKLHPVQRSDCELFLEAHDRAPREIVLDLDNTDIPLHGGQEGRFFHGYYDEFCYLPLYVFCGRHHDQAAHSFAVSSGEHALRTHAEHDRFPPAATHRAVRPDARRPTPLRTNVRCHLRMRGVMRD